MKDNILYIHPRPYAKYVNIKTRLILRLNEPSSVQNPRFLIHGSKSGKIRGELSISKYSQTMLFVPDQPFQPNEDVFITLVINDEDYSYQFKTGKPAFNQPHHDFQEDQSAGQSSCRLLKTSEEPTILSNGVSVPRDFPFITVIINDQPDSGKIFLHNRDNNAPFIMIYNNDGTPYWYRKVEHFMRGFDRQPTGLLTGLGLIDHGGSLEPAYYIGMDSTYAVVDTFYAGTGYFIDEHELVVLPDNHYLVIVFDYQEIDMSKEVPGGNPHALVDATHIQKLDEKDQVIWEWNSLTHFELSDLDPVMQNPTDYYIDFPHINSIDIDDDGHLVISSRHTSEVTKINSETGEIIWRLGGKKNQFIFKDDPFNGFSAQHDARCLGNGHYTLFDNGNGHQPPESRAVEYVIDTKSMTATLIWQLRESPRKFAYRFGNVQQLPGGNRLINWGGSAYPKLTEIRPDGSKAYEMNFINPSECDRVHRYPWNVPEKKPYLLIDSGLGGATLLFNQFGDSHVDYYRIYSGTSPHPTTLLDTSRLTMKRFDRFEQSGYYFFHVTSVSQSGKESGFSNEESMLIKMIQPGENQILNSDFSQQDAYWELRSSGNVTMTGQVQDDTYHIHVSQAGNDAWAVYLGQAQVNMVKRQTYVLEFEAWANERIRLQPAVVHALSGTDYSRIGQIQLTAQKQKFTYEFSPSSSNASAVLVFIVNEKPGEVSIDNVSLKQVVTAIDQPVSMIHPSRYTLSLNFPNPFNGTTTFKFLSPYQSRISLTLHDLTGKKIREIKRGLVEPGIHRFIFSDASLSSGVYFYRLEAHSSDGNQSFNQTRKLIYLK